MVASFSILLKHALIKDAHSSEITLHNFRPYTKWY